MGRGRLCLSFGGAPGGSGLTVRPASATDDTRHGGFIFSAARGLSVFGRGGPGAGIGGGGGGCVFTAGSCFDTVAGVVGGGGGKLGRFARSSARCFTLSLASWLHASDDGRNDVASFEVAVESFNEVSEVVSLPPSAPPLVD